MVTNSYQTKKEDLLEELSTSSQGLSSQEAAARNERYGLNSLKDKKKKPVLLIFLEQYKDFLVIILIVAAIISAFLGDFESSLVIFLVITLNAILGTVQNVKAEQSLNSLKSLTAPMAKVLRNGDAITIPSKEVTLGDIVILEAGDSICADGRIIENAGLQVNESSLTGESLPVEKEDCSLEGEPALGDQKNMVFAGCFVTYGRARFVVTAIGMDSQIGKVATLLNNTSEKATPLQQNLDQFGKRLSLIILVICALLFVLSISRGEGIMSAFMFAVALAVAAIPEALSSIVTIVLSFGTQKMIQENAIVKKLPAVEGLGSVSIICSDKTGTLTQNKMSIQKISVNTEIIEKDHLDFTDPLEKKLLNMSLLCSDATILDGNLMGDPTELSFVLLAEDFGISTSEVRTTFPRLQEIPFDSDRKLMSTLHTIEGTPLLVTKGAVDALLNRLVSIETKDGITPITQNDKEKIEAINQTFSESGLRVLAFAYKEFSDARSLTLEDEQGYTFLGLMAMMDPPREEAKNAVAECVKAGIRPIMITGDHKITASSIARQIGILKEEDIAVDGKEIDDLSDEELKDYVEKVSVYARVSPEHKIRIVRAWQERGNIVAMTGDGVNDAPALKQADIGVAMGITGSEVSKDAASMVLTDDNFATIVTAVRNGRNIYANIKKSIQFLLSGNTAGILSVLYASLLALPLPFAPVHLLFINLLTDSLPAIALGMEPHSSSVMSVKPRPKEESILTKSFMISILSEGLVLAFTTMAAYYVGLSSSNGHAMTMAFATLCLSRLVHGFNTKSEKPVLFTKHFFTNPYLWLAFFIGFILLNLVLLVPFLQPVFAVTALSLKQLLTIYGLSLSNLFIIQLLKFFKNIKK
ncbi:MAG: cation-translocating P-type ATPase [Acetivibrio sp.]